MGPLNNCPQTGLVTADANCKMDVFSVFQEGENLIQTFLDKAKSLPVATMSDEEVKVELKRMKQELVGKNNTYVSEMLMRCVPAETA